MLVRRFKSIFKKPFSCAGATGALSFSSSCNRDVVYADTAARNHLTQRCLNVKRFVNVVLATDDTSLVKDNITRKYGKSKPIVQGELRTHSGNRLKHYGPTYRTDFCLHGQLSLLNVVARLAKSFYQTSSADIWGAARGTIYQT